MTFLLTLTQSQMTNTQLLCEFIGREQAALDASRIKNGKQMTADFINYLIS